MKKWNKSTDGASLPTYSLSKEYNSIWFANVFPRDGKYIFTIGQRVTKDESTPSRYTWQNVGWKNPSENPVIYFVADKDDNRIDNLHSWNGNVFDFDELLKY